MDNTKKQEVPVKRYRGATISVVANGFIITIGCQTVVAESAESLKKLISAYLDDPSGTEQKLFKNSMEFNRGPDCAPQVTPLVDTDRIVGTSTCVSAG